MVFHFTQNLHSAFIVYHYQSLRLSSWIRATALIMLSDISDLTDLSSLEDDYEQPTKNTKSSKKSSYRLRNVLKPGRTTQYTAKALYGER